MIVEMKKVTVLGLAGQMESILGQLRDLGVMHVRPVKAVASPSLDALANDIGRTTAALNLLLAAGPGPSLETDPGRIVAGLAASSEKRRQVREELNQLSREADRVAYLGDFDLAAVQALEKKGVTLRLYALSKKQLSQIPPDLPHRILGENQGKSILAAVLYQAAKAPSFEEIPWPGRSLRQVRGLIASRQQEAEALAAELKK